MIRIFLTNLEQIFGWLIQASWQASVLVALVLMIQRVFRSRLNSRSTHALWLLVIARLLLPALPESAFSLFQFAPPPPPVIVASVTEPIFAPVSLTANDLPAPQPAVAPHYPYSVWTLLALTWLTGALGLLILTWQVNRRFGHHVRNSPPVDDPVLLQIASAAQIELGVHRSLRLIESSHVQGPAIMGLIHPTLILPQNVRDKFTNSELRFIFLHEFAHLKRGDLVLQWLVAILQILHWFNPVLWFAFRRMRADREPATDALVLSRTGDAEQYGHVLIKLLEHYHQRQALPTLVGILEDKDQFKRRFTLISQFTRGAYGWSLLGTLILGTLATVGLTAAREKAGAQDSGASAEQRKLTSALNEVRLDGIRSLPLDQFIAQIPALLRKNDPQHLAAVKINVTKFGNEPWIDIDAKDIPATHLGYLLYRLKLIYPLNYRIRDGHIDVWQLSKAEVAFHEKAKTTKIDVDFDGANASAALKTIAEASAAKGFAFPIAHLDELQNSEAQEANPVTLHAKQIDVEAALRAVCYLGTLAGKPTQSAIGFEVSRQDVEAAKANTELRMGLEVIDHDAGDTAGLAQLLANIGDNLRHAHGLSGPSVIGPAYPWTYQGKTRQSGAFLGVPAQPGRGIGYMTNGHVSMIDKTHFQFTCTIDIQGAGGKSLGKISGQWTQPSGVVQLLVGGQPMIVTLPDATHARKALVILADSTLVDDDGNPLLPLPDNIHDVSLTESVSADAGLGSGDEATGEDTADASAFFKTLEKDRRMVADTRVKSSTLAADAQMLLAIQKGDVASLKKVLEHGVDPNTFDPDRFGSSPAYWAVYFNKPECLKLLLDHFAKAYDGPMHRGDQSAVELAQKTHPELVPILLDASKRNRAALTAQLVAKLHSIRTNLPAFYHAPLSQVNDYLLDATSKAGYLERGVNIASLDLPPSTTITSPVTANLTLWDALQIITSKNNLRFDVDDQEIGEITLYPPKSEAIIKHQNPNGISEQAAQSPPKLLLGVPSADQIQPIIAAVKKDDTTALAKLVDGFDAGQIRDGDEPLLFDARSPEVVKILLDHGADANARDKSGALAWQRMCLNAGKNAAPIAELLLDYGADPNARFDRPDGPTPLFYAEDAATVDVLIKHGADVHAKMDDGSTPLTRSSLYNPDVLAAMLRDGVSFDPKTDGPTLLVRAAGSHNLPMVKDLLLRGVDPNAAGVFAKRPNGKPVAETPLEAAAITGASEVTNLLLDHGARGDKEMITALHNAGSMGVVKSLWSHGVRAISPLCYAVSQNATVPDLQKLLDAGSPIDPPQDQILTPLGTAALLGNFDTVKFLVARGADVNKGGVFNPAFPIYRLAPMVMAAAEGQDEIVSFLLAHGAKADPVALWQAADNSTPYPGQRSRDHFEETVRILLEAGALKNASREQEGYIVSAAIGTRQGPSNTTVLKMLLDAGADPGVPMPYIVENGEKPDSVLGYYRSLYAKAETDPTKYGDAQRLKPSLDLLEAKIGNKSTNTTVNLPVPWLGPALTVSREPNQS